MPLLLLTACPAGPSTREVPLLLRLDEVMVADAPLTWSEATWGARLARVRPCGEPDLTLDWPELDPPQRDLPALTRPLPVSVGFTDPASLLAVRSATLPVGPWCAFDVIVDGTLRATGTAEATGARLELEVALTDLVLAEGSAPFGGVTVEVRAAGGLELPSFTLLPLIVELGAPGWLDAVMPALAAGTDAQVALGSGEADALAEALIAGAVLGLDRDRDGQLSDAERAEALVGPLAPE